jgi:hypothetical protein
MNLFWLLLLIILIVAISIGLWELYVPEPIQTIYRNFCIVIKTAITNFIISIRDFFKNIFQKRQI